MKGYPQIQFAIADDCSLTSQKYNASIPASYNIGSVVATMKQQMSSWKDWDNSDLYASNLVQLDTDGHYFYKDDYYIYLITDKKGTYTLRRLMGIDWAGYSYSKESAVQYAPNKFAYIDPDGYVRHINYSNSFAATCDKEIWQALRDAADRKDKDTILNIISYQLDLYESEPSVNYITDDRPVISVIAGTRDADLVISCLNYAESLVYMGWAVKTPISWICEQNDPELLDAVLQAKPELVTRRYDGGMGPEANPVRELIEDDKVDLVRVFIKYFDDVNDVEVLMRSEHDFDGGDYWNTVNMLSYAVSDEMKQLLIEAGVKTTIPFTKSWAVDTYLTDSKVNIRSAPSLSGKVIDQLNEGDKVSVIAVDPYFYTIDYYTGHWIQIRFKDGKTGYIFEKYIYQYWQ